MGRLEWYTHRLLAMRPAEIAWRTRRAVGQHLPARPLSDTDLLGADPDWHAALERFRRSERRPVLLDRERARLVARTDEAAVAATIAAADRVLEHRFCFFAYPEARLGRPIDWNYDPVGDVHWPPLPSHRIDHRVSDGDPKWIWELNRLQHLPWLAQAWLFTDSPCYAAEVFEQLDTWIATNPPGRGIAWRGAFEAGIRAISVAVAVQGLRDSPELTVERFRRIVQMLAESARRCRVERSRYSSANNHLVGELAGQAVVALLFPDLRPAPRWERDALEALRTEADRQILPDGAGAEQAAAYQVFTAELFLVVTTALLRRDDAAPLELVDAITRSADYLAAFVGHDDPLPRYGDDDEGFALRLDAAPLRSVRDHLGTVGAVLGVEEARRRGTPTTSALWLASDLDDAMRPPRAVPPPTTGHFAPDGGLVVLRSGRRRLTMDVGPLGYLSIAAHGHADALAVTLAVDGHDVIGHPGAASYYGHPAWREVHRGTRAHPTVSVDDTNQSVIGGAFLWRTGAQVRVRSVDLVRGIVEAEHDGYERLADPVVHRRWLIAPPGAGTTLVVDLLDGRGRHVVRTSWPLHPSLDITPLDRGHLVCRDHIPILHVAYACSVADPVREEVRGDPDGNLGWWSHRLESREPAWWVGVRCTAEVPFVLVTALAPAGEDGTSVSGLTVERDDTTIEVCWSDTDGAHRQLLPLDSGAPGRDLTAPPHRSGMDEISPVGP